MHSVGETSWCYFRCLVQASYREARHIGPPGDHEAKCEVTDKFAEAAALCARNRTTLKGLGLWKSSERAETTPEVLAPYVSASGLDPEELPELFLHSGWRTSYGGPLWSRIAEVMNRLRTAIDEGDNAMAHALCVETRTLRHNSGQLVPSADKWAANRWLREKWPHQCA
jgi:hypothetical protein